jgi:porin
LGLPFPVCPTQGEPANPITIADPPKGIAMLACLVRAMARPTSSALVLALPASWLCAGPTHAQTAPATDQPAPAQAAPAADQSTCAPGPTDLLDPARTALLGDMGGLRSALCRIGVTLQIQDINELFGNVSGGTGRGADYDGLTTATLGLDTGTAFKLPGGTFNLSVLNIRGRNISADNLHDLQTASGISATPTTRLWEVWYEQAFPDANFDVKLGQQSLDQEFIISQGSALFLNSMMGWPMLPSADLYAGGPAYPLSSLGVRVRAQPGGGFTALAGVFQDNPPGGPFAGDGQLLGTTRWGGNFNLRTGALFIAEVQYALNPPPAGGADTGEHPTGLPGTYKLGFWYDTGSFPSPPFDSTGVALATSSSSGAPSELPNNYSVYAVMDQMVWRPDEKAPQALGVFARVMGAPNDRNLISFSANAGATLKAPLPGRDSDTLGLGFGIAKVSNAVNGSDTESSTGTGFPGRTSETFLELTYQVQLTPWWQVQPDFQYVFNPGGGVPNPNTPGKRIGDEAVFGLRSTVTF